MPNPVQRLHYFDQQFLRAVDFTAEQDYHLGLRRAHNRSVHGWGVARGLAVDVTGTSSVTVRSGYALDSAGREIVLTEDVPLDLAAQAAGASVFITIAYAERTTDPSDETGVRDDTRWTEEPTIAVATSAPSDPSATLVLGRATRAGTQITGIDLTGRVAASIPALAAALRAEIATRVAKAGDTITGALTVQGAVTAQGTVTAGSFNTGGALSASAGAVANGVSVGRDPGGGVDYPFEYESVGVASPKFNLRLQSPNGILFHTGGAQRAWFDTSGALAIAGDAGASVRLLVGAGANGRIKVRHIDGKHWQSDNDDALYLNWTSQLPVNLGGNLNWSGDGSPSGYVRLGRLQICWGRQSVNLTIMQVEVDTPFPQAFAQVPAVVTSINDPGPNSVEPLSASGAWNVSTTRFSMLIKSRTKPLGWVDASYIAIGIWQ